MGKADSLSRQPDWQKGVEKNNKNRMLEKIRKSETKDDKVIRAIEEMKRVGVKMLRDKEWRKENELMLRDGKVYVPKDEKLRAEVI